MSKRSVDTFRLAAPALAVGLMVALAPTDARGCTCFSTNTTGAEEIGGLVAGGSTAIVTALQMGFDKTAAQVNASSADSAQKIVSAISGMTNALSAEILAQPAREIGIQAERAAKSPALHATNECEYLQRSGDSAAADVIVGAQQEALNQSVVAYNEVVSQYPETTNATSAFKAQTNQLLMGSPGVKTAPLNVINAPNTIGSMTTEEFQDASRALNLTLNPVPARKLQNPATPAQIGQNVDAELYNMRMQVPQGISQAILAYESPILNLPEDSWFASILERMSPADHEEFTSEGKSVSYSDLLKHMATHRMKDPVATVNAATKSEEGLLKDLALVKSDHLVMDYELWIQDRYQSLLLAQMVASQVRQERK